MSRKVYLEGEATVMLPVRVKFSMMLRADNDASINKAVKLASQGKRYAKADVEQLDVDEIIDLNGYGDEENPADELDAAVQDALEHGTFTVHKTEVIDSR